MPRSVREVILKQAATAERIARGHPWVWREAIARGLDGDGARRRGAARGAGRRAGRARPGRPELAHRGPRLDATARAHRRRALARRGRRGPASCALVALRRDPHGRVPRAARRGGPNAGARGRPLRTGGRRARRRRRRSGEESPSSPTRSGPRSRHGACARSFCARREGTDAPRHEILRGAPLPDTVQVEEHGVAFVVDLAHGQKTGAFLDQRENRRRVGELARGRRVLNLFSYAGGFSLHAALGGATHVTSVDVAAAAHATAQASFRVGGRRPERARVRHGRRARIPRRSARRRAETMGPHRQRSPELRAEREGAAARALGVPSAARRVRRRPRPRRHPLRRVVLEPRRRRGLPLDARRRRAGRARAGDPRASRRRPRPPHPRRPSPKAATSSSPCSESGRRKRPIPMARARARRRACRRLARDRGRSRAARSAGRGRADRTSPDERGRGHRCATGRRRRADRAP